MTNLIKRIFDPSDRSIELHDVIGVGTLLTHAGIALHSAFHGATVDLAGFGTGAAALIAAMGGAGWMKGKQATTDQSPQERN